MGPESWSQLKFEKILPALEKIIETQARKLYFSNFSCMFLNPNISFQFEF